MSDEILKIFPGGLEKLINKRGPSKEEISFVLVFNCPQEYYTHLKKCFVLNPDIEETEKYLPKYDFPPDTLFGFIEDMVYHQELFDIIIEKIKKRRANLNDSSNPCLNYEELCIFLLSIVKFLTNLKIKVEICPTENKLYFVLWGDEDRYDHIASIFNYELQLKPYAQYYDNFEKSLRNLQVQKRNLDGFTDTQSNEQKPPDSNNNKNINNISSSNVNTSIVLKEDEKNLLETNAMQFNLQFMYQDEDNILHWPPYNEFGMNKLTKFRRYTSKDEYHFCNNDPEFFLVPENEIEEADCCSKFRGIDKIRLINNLLDRILKYWNLRTNKILETTISRKNFENYEENFNWGSFIKNYWMIFFNHECMAKFINDKRNFYGEMVSYYFLWVLHLNKWLIFPSILGIITGILGSFNVINLKVGEIKTFRGLKFNYYDFTLIIFCFLITVWATLFVKSWTQKEQFYNYIWGMENHKFNEPLEEGFKYDINLPFIFGKYLYISSRVKRFFKDLVSYIIILTLAAANILFIYYLFRWKAINTHNGQDSSLFWPVVTATINAVTIQIFSFIYGYIATWLTDWENHERFSHKENSMAIKLIIFEFVNKYFSLYYIAFIKPYLYEYCLFENCLKELDIELYIILLVRFLFDIVDILIAWLLSAYKRRKFFNKIQYQLKNESLLEFHKNNPYTIDNLYIKIEYKSLIGEYNEIIILFGYVCFFSVASPFTPVIIFIIIYVNKYSDSLKMFHFYRVSMIEGASGINIYNKILKFFYVIGMLTNIGILLFTSPNLMNVAVYRKYSLFDNYDFILKILVVAVFENFVLIIALINISLLPKCKHILTLGFKYLPQIKSLYNDNFFNKESKYLPHRYIN